MKKRNYYVLWELLLTITVLPSCSFAWGEGNELYKASQHADGHPPSISTYTMPPMYTPAPPTYQYLQPQQNNYQVPARQNSKVNRNKRSDIVSAGRKGSVSTANLPPLKDIQKNFRTMLSAQGITSAENLKDQNFAWVFNDDLDTVKVLLRENKNNAWLAFSEQTEPWYKDNPYCVGAISGFSQFNDNTFVWAPPTMEEHIRAFFKLKCSDAALQRLCEAQFITNYNVLHYKVFCSRLMKIQGQAKGKDATALITAYAKELEAKGPKVFQEREAWRGEPFDVSSIESRIQVMQDDFTKKNFVYDPQILRDTMLARFERVETTGQDITLRCCIGSLRNHSYLLENNGLKSDLNKGLQKYTHWLRHTKSLVPSTNEIWKKS